MLTDSGLFYSNLGGRLHPNGRVPNVPTSPPPSPKGLSACGPPLAPIGLRARGVARVVYCKRLALAHSRLAVAANLPHPSGRGAKAVMRQQELPHSSPLPAVPAGPSAPVTPPPPDRSGQPRPIGPPTGRPGQRGPARKAARFKFTLTLALPKAASSPRPSQPTVRIPWSCPQPRRGARVGLAIASARPLGDEGQDAQTRGLWRGNPRIPRQGLRRGPLDPDPSGTSPSEAREGAIASRLAYLIGWDQPRAGGRGGGGGGPSSRTTGPRRIRS
jgi:hypothetical protein